MESYNFPGGQIKRIISVGYLSCGFTNMSKIFGEHSITLILYDMQQLLSENNLDYFASRNINVQTISI